MAGIFGMVLRLSKQPVPLQIPAADLEREAVFFLLTNVLIVFGLIAFDLSMAVLQSFPLVFPTIPSFPSPLRLIQAILLPVSNYDEARIGGLQESLARLRKKSRSFYLASSVFQGRLRIDLILLWANHLHAFGVTY